MEKKSSEKEDTNRRGEFDDLISALRTGDVFGDDVRKYGGRRKKGEKSGKTSGNGVENRERTQTKF